MAITFRRRTWDRAGGGAQAGARGRTEGHNVVQHQQHQSALDWVRGAMQGNLMSGWVHGHWALRC